MMNAERTFATIYSVVRAIPAGRVSSYGRIALLAGVPGQARLVGYALHALRFANASDPVPWWRVISATGRISNPYESDLQRALLEAEGVVFDDRERVDFRRFLWEG